MAPCQAPGTFTGSLFKYITLRYVVDYSTAATSDAAFIIGGYQDGYYSTTITEFKNNQWRKVGDLAQARYGHSSISVGLRTMIVGGVTASST